MRRKNSRPTQPSPKKRQRTLANNSQEQQGIQSQFQQELAAPQEEEEEVTLNIFEVLSCDLQTYLLTFMKLKELYHVSLSCKQGSYLVMSPDTDGYLWKLIANRLGLQHFYEEFTRAHSEEVKMLKKTTETTSPASCRNACLWRELVRSNMIYWDPNTRAPDSEIQMHNLNKTISCEGTQDWHTILTNRKLEMGMVHCWEITLDDFGSYDGLGPVVAGIAGSDLVQAKGDHKIIGHGTEGIGFNVPHHLVHRDSSRTHFVKVVLPEDSNFITGDTIAMVLDLKNLMRSESARMHLFKNEEYFHTVQDIPTKGRVLYCPAISVLGNQQVSIRMKHSSTLRMW